MKISLSLFSEEKLRTAPLIDFIIINIITTVRGHL